VFILGSGPYFAFLVLDLLDTEFARKNPNPVLLGGMLWFTFVPSIVLMIIGMVRWIDGKDDWKDWW
jgi:hypothetical protein